MQKLFYLSVIFSVVAFGGSPAFADIDASLTSTGLFELLKPVQSAVGMPTPTGWVLCNIIEMVTSDIGRGFAILMVIFTGIGAALGKISWPQAVLLGVGITAIMGAPSLVLSIRADDPEMSLIEWAEGCNPPENS